MRTFEELIEEQEKIQRVIELMEEMLGEPALEKQKLFKIAEILQKEEYFIIFVMHNGLWGQKKYSYAEIGRFLGKKRAVIRKKYLIAKRMLEERLCISMN